MAEGTPRAAWGSVTRDPVAWFHAHFDEAPTGCWLWTHRVNNNGYGKMRLRVSDVYAHRWAFEHFVGPIPEGLELDHLCRNPLCVNPTHLEPVTHAENMARGYRAMKTHCFRGHEFTLENTYFRPDTGTRQCRRCQYESNKRGRTQKGVS